MNYYQLSKSINLKEIGSQYPQIQKMTKGYDYDAPNSAHSLSRCLFKFPDFVPNLNSFVLPRSAKLTDLLSTGVMSNNGFLVSSRLKCIFEKYHTAPIRFYEATLLKKDELIKDYYWMHIISDFSDNVDYVNSSFVVLDFSQKVIGEIKVTSKADLKNKREQLRIEKDDRFISIKASKLIMDASVGAFALFEIGCFDYTYYINENLKNEIISEGITGCAIEKAEHITI